MAKFKAFLPCSYFFN